MASSIPTISDPFYGTIGLHLQAIPKNYKISEISIKIILTTFVKQEYFEGTIKTPISFSFSYKDFGSGDLNEVSELLNNLSTKTYEAVEASASFALRTESRIRYLLPNKKIDESNHMGELVANDTRMYLNKNNYAKT